MVSRSDYLEVTLESYPRCRTVILDYAVDKSSSKNNVLLGRPTMQKFGAIFSKVHGLVNLPTRRGIATIKGNLKLLKECAYLKQYHYNRTYIKNRRLCSNNCQVPKAKIIIGKQLPIIFRQRLINLMLRNNDIFAWQPSYMTAVPMELAKHHLKANPIIIPIKYKKINK